MLSLCPEDVQEGRIDEKPLDVPSILSEEFECFLDFQMRQYVNTSLLWCQFTNRRC